MTIRAKRIQNDGSIPIKHGKLIVYPNRDVNDLILKAFQRNTRLTAFCLTKVALELGKVQKVKGVIFHPESRCNRNAENRWETALSVVIFSHLFTNSVKAGARTFKVNTSVDNDSVIIDIADDGCGIPKKYEKRLFRKGATFTTDHFNGTQGYGLYYSREAMRMVGGTIELISNVPIEEATGEMVSGVTFRLRLPVNPAVPS